MKFLIRNVFLVISLTACTYFVGSAQTKQKPVSGENVPTPKADSDSGYINDAFDPSKVIDLVTKPRINMRSAVKIAIRTLNRENIDMSHHFLAEASLQSGKATEMKSRYWSIRWEPSTKGGEGVIFVKVSMEGKAIHVQ